MHRLPVMPIFTPRGAPSKDVPAWVRIPIAGVAFLLLGPIVVGMLAAFALTIGPLLLPIWFNSLEVVGDREGRPRQFRARSIPLSSKLPEPLRGLAPS